MARSLGIGRGRLLPFRKKDDCPESPERPQKPLPGPGQQCHGAQGPGLPSLLQLPSRWLRPVGKGVGRVGITSHAGVD